MTITVHTRVFSDGTTVVYDPTSPPADLSRHARRDDDQRRIRRVYRQDRHDDAQPRGPREDLADAVRDMWRQGRAADRTDAGQLLGMHSDNPRERLAGETADMWRINRGAA